MTGETVTVIVFVAIVLAVCLIVRFIALIGKTSGSHRR